MAFDACKGVREAIFDRACWAGFGLAFDCWDLEPCVTLSSMLLSDWESGTKTIVYLVVFQKANLIPDGVPTLAKVVKISLLVPKEKEDSWATQAFFFNGCSALSSLVVPIWIEAINLLNNNQWYEIEPVWSFCATVQKRSSRTVVWVLLGMPNCTDSLFRKSKKINISLILFYNKLYIYVL